MAWSHSADLWCLDAPTNYAAALRRWENIKPIRGRDSNDRPLMGRAQNQFGIHQLSDGSIAYRLYLTDVVTYRPDGTIRLECWSSIATDQFANALLPSSIYTRFNALTSHVVLNAIAYPIDSEMILAPTANGWKVVTDGNKSRPTFSEYRLDRKAWNAAKRKYAFDDFARWLKAREALNGRQFTKARRPRQGDLISFLERGPEGWLEAARVYTDPLEYARKDIIAAERCVVRTQHESLPQDRVTSVLRSEKEWGGMAWRS